MKVKVALALVLCVAAAAIFAPVKAEEDAAAQFDENDVSAGEIVKLLSRKLKEAEGNAEADEGEVDTAGTQLQQDPSSHMMRDLKYYYYKKHHYPRFSKYPTTQKKGRRLQSYKKSYPDFMKYDHHKKYYPIYKKRYNGRRRLQSYKKYYPKFKKHYYPRYKKYYYSSGHRLQ